MAKTSQIPTYSLDKFKSTLGENSSYQVEVFDANRHFEVQYPHKHDFYEVLFLQNGSGYHIIDNNRYEIKPPCIFFLSPGQAHKLELSKDIAGYIFLFTDDFYLLNKSNKYRLLELPFFYNVNYENAPLQLEMNDVPLFQVLFEQGCRLMSESKDDHETMNSLLDLLLNSANLIYPKEVVGESRLKGHVLVKRFRKLIEEKYQENITVNKYAELLHVTPNHLTQTVKSISGKTSAELIKERTILEIKRLLRYTDLTATEIALQLNYSDQSYFTKFFKKVVGVTPKEFRIKSLKST